MPLLRQLLSPSWPFELTTGQRVDAYKYLGASLVLVGRSDSAAVFFRAALERDAFADLDPAQFTPAQLAVFTAARRQAFATGLRPMQTATVDPRTARVPFTVATTHAATLHVRLQANDDTAAFPIYEGAADGITTLGWDGLGPDRTLALPGRYLLTVVARSRLATATDSAQLFFDLEHERDSLDDTLPALGPEDLLPERAPPGAATGELMKGMGVAAVVLTIATGLSSARLGDAERARPAVVAGAGLAAGLYAYLHQRKHRDLPANVAENARRRAEREQANAAIRARNAERIARTVLVIRPAAGLAP